MTAKHTPGPWKVCDFKNNGLSYTVVSPAGDAELGNWLVADEVRWIENAHLIAAAPDLLAACMAWKDHTEKSYPSTPEGMTQFGRDLLAVHEKMRTVIAKATTGA